ncbi:UNVERIFIED_CONTAM: UDP-glycosyltransferase 91D2 [Sesamum latifolium]|uniref:UDP-glycosyltransferase 91D2 n=1 Tax=Sesamum latifolium TaxID=2727402 RepID=A0AAW2X793_9LAMI
MDIHGGQMDHLKKAFDSLEPGLTRFLEDSSPDWIIYDFAAHWLPPVAARLGISRAFYSNNNAWFAAFFGPTDALISDYDDRTKPDDFMVPPKWAKFETKVAYRRHEADWIVTMGQINQSGFSDFYRVGKVLLGCEAILTRHCYEFEPEWLTLLEELHHRPVIPLGIRARPDGAAEWIRGESLNSRVIVEKQLGVEILRNEQDGSCTRNSVADSIKLVMLEKEGVN